MVRSAPPSLLFSREKQVRHQLFAWADSVGVQVDDSRFSEHLVVDEEIPGEARLATKDFIGRVGYDLRFAPFLGDGFSSEEISHCCGVDDGAGPQAVGGDAVLFEFVGKTQRAHAHAKFGDGVRDVRSEVFGTEIERGAQREDAGVAALFQIGQAFLGAEERAARVDVVHQVVALHRSVGRPS